MTSEEKKEAAANLLRQKADELGRIPKKEDFDVVSVSRIKAYLGPWPRALEYAGLKIAKNKPAKSKKRKSGKSKEQRLTALKKLEKNRCKSEQHETETI